MVLSVLPGLQYAVPLAVKLPFRLEAGAPFRENVAEPLSPSVLLTATCPDNAEVVPLPEPDTLSSPLPMPVTENDTAPPGLTVPENVPLNVMAPVPSQPTAVPPPKADAVKLPPEAVSVSSEG